MPRVYVGNLPYNVRERDIEDLFLKFGRIRTLDLKTPMRGAPFAFLEFEDERDADEAIHRRSGYDFDGNRLRVELSRGGRNGNAGGGQGRGPPKRSENRVVVTGLPRSASWQDLKDHMRRGGDVGYANTFGDGSGVVEYGSYDDMRNAIRRLDESEFRNPYDRAIIRVREERGGGGGRGGGRRRSRSRSPRRRRSRSGDRRRRSRSRSPARRRRSRSPARRSRSPARRSRSPAKDDAAKKSKSRSRSGSAGRKSKSKSKSRSRSRSAPRKSKSKSKSPARKSASRSKSPAAAPAKSASRSRSGSR